MRTLICSLAVLVAGYSNAAVMVTGEVSDLGGGLSQILVNIASDTGPIATVDFSAGGTDPSVDSGFFGPLNQVQFFSQPTVNNNFASPVPGQYDPSLDSRFLFNTGSGMGVNVALAETEGANFLKGAYNLTEAVSSLNVARLVVPTSALGVVTYSGNVVLADLTRVEITGMLPGGSTDIPEPSTLALAGLAIAGVMLRRRVA
ncbi:hypothetical protein Pla175_04780 [Pirellulimonas nuda]|uniref:Ice-binding protein C-terminal domain-containing protein n=2 Tax=Pirellulimonas nuda TaxID=2528009 RepID=A0A518D6L0_9BACT|nr:hypothetical protein Pla175_04780 [Pirellulimonas nuda]